MNKDSAYQMELFTNPGEPKASPGLPAYLRKFIRTYERVVVVLIGVIIVGIATFSLGVKWGAKKAQGEFITNTAVSKDISSGSVKVLPALRQKPLPAPVVAPVVEKKILKEPVKVLDKAGKYTIQLATYKDSVGAKNEAMVLKKKGFSTIILPSKNYIVLCIGNFSTKETAGVLLAKLKKQYRDCFIRRL